MDNAGDTYNGGTTRYDEDVPTPGIEFTVQLDTETARMLAELLTQDGIKLPEMIYHLIKEEYVSRLMIRKELFG